MASKKKLKDNLKRIFFKEDIDFNGPIHELAESFEKSLNGIRDVLAELKSSQGATSKENTKGIEALKKEVASNKIDLSPLVKTIKESKVDISPMISSLNSLEALMASKREYSDEGILTALMSVEKRLAEILASKNDIYQEDRTDDIVKAIQGIQVMQPPQPEIQFPDSISVNNFPPQKVPTPVTNININPLRGDYLATRVTVNNTATALPSSQMENRRSLIIYNESMNTIYLGDSEVTELDGFPVLPESYSPPFDSGDKMTLYGISTHDSIVRVLEISNDSIGG